MTDRAIFLGMAGAKDSMFQLNLIANNLANANTIGFRADAAVIEADHSSSSQKDSRSYTKLARTYSDFKPGPMISTGRNLDIAIDGAGFIAVQTKEGKEAYTRNGSLQVNADGFLVTSKGDLVLGAGGVISLPLSQHININRHGGVSAQLAGQTPSDLTTVDSIKLVNAPIEKLQKGADGLFHLAEGGSATESQDVRLVPETLEGSNVDTVKSMVDLIDVSRKFEIHTKLMKMLEDNALRSNQTLNIAE
jgi:flagellar basal-body rod protein FlgF